MWPVIPAPLTAGAIVVAFALAVLATRVVQPAWWRARTAVFGVFGVMVAAYLLWGIGAFVGSDAIVRMGAGVTYCLVLVVLPAAVVLPFAALIDRALARRSSAAGRTDEKVISRRALLRFGTASLPALAATAGVNGLVDARRDPKMPIVRVRWPNLHPDLDGLRILHLSDLHLGACLGPEDLARALETAKAARPDLIVLTGDLADWPPFITEALDLVTRANARHGALACLGNHEYIHGIGVTRRLYEKSAVPLLCSSGRTLRIGEAKLFVGGADDPVTMRGDIAARLAPSIAQAAADAPEDADFRLLLCHRPEGHGPATENGFDLTLAGHTHGGQIGLFGRSLLEMLEPAIGWWGTYAKKRPARARGPGGPSRLYTSSGFGHWFPFRLGCPTEMPLVVLEAEERPPSARDAA